MVKIHAPQKKPTPVKLPPLRLMPPIAHTAKEYSIQSDPVEDTAVPVLEAQRMAANDARPQESALHMIFTISTLIPESAAAASFPPVASILRPNLILLKKTARIRTKIIIRINNADVFPTCALPRLVRFSGSV